jgi:hypothetical protein
MNDDFVTKLNYFWESYKEIESFECSSRKFDGYFFRFFLIFVDLIIRTGLSKFFL